LTPIAPFAPLPHCLIASLPHCYRACPYR
jgi:hypothetical protein